MKRRRNFINKYIYIYLYIIFVDIIALKKEKKNTSASPYLRRQECARAYINNVNIYVCVCIASLYNQQIPHSIAAKRCFLSFTACYKSRYNWNRFESSCVTIQSAVILPTLQ